MSSVPFTGLVALCAALAACSESPTSRSHAPSDAVPSFDLASPPEGSFGTTAEDPFDEAVTTGDVSSQQVATGGRASGRIGFEVVPPPFAGSVVSEKYSFNAESVEPALTLAAKGQYELHLVATDLEELKSHGEVICLGVVGNTARVGGRVTNLRRNNVQQTLPPGGLFNLWTVTDNGEGKGTQDMASLARFAIFEVAARSHCLVGRALESLPSDEGNVQVSSQ
jgi:hypothetical protein